jgi:pimeloyl-ACP methyl ester carboxylesterase
MPNSAPATFVLVHSPLTGPVAWGSLPTVLRERGRAVVVVDVADDDAPPYASRFVARAALQLREQAGDAPAVLVGHSGAGYLLPLLGAARRAARVPVRGYVFLDAGLPPSRPASRLDLMRAESPEHADELVALLDAGGRYPDWPDADLRRLARPRGRDFFDEQLPVAPDWPDAPCGYLRLSPSYDGPARVARLRGWPVLDGPDDRPGGHFAMLVDAAAVADDLESLLAQL